MPARDSFERVDVARLSPKVHANNARRPRRNQFLDARWINRVRMRIDITKNRSEAKPLYGMSGGNERKSRYDHFVAHFHCANGQLQPIGRVAHGFAVADAQKLSQALFKLLDAGARVGEPAAVHYLADSREQLLLVTNVWTPNVELLHEAHWAAQNSQIVYVFLCQQKFNPSQLIICSLTNPSALKVLLALSKTHSAIARRTESLS